MARKTKTDTPAPEPLWSDKATGGGRGKHLGVRWAVFVLVILVSSGLLIRAFRPVNQTIVNEAPKVSISTVGEYAAAFATDWFTWHAGSSAERTARLDVYNPRLDQAGWNGSGNQTVTDARVFAQEDVGEHRYRVTVRITVSTSAAPFYVDVLAVDNNGALAILSVPTVVPGPSLASTVVTHDTTPAEIDAATVTAINAQLDLFFAAWATGDQTLAQFVYQGVQIAPIGGGLTLADVASVTVPALAKGADTTHRTVLAKVQWRWPDGVAQAPATYKVDIVLASGKWFISHIEGGVLDETIAPLVTTGAPATPHAQATGIATPTPGATSGISVVPTGSATANVPGTGD